MTPPVSSLRAVIEAYLRAAGVSSYVQDGREYWAHRELGLGRSFTAALAWVIGREEAGPGSTGYIGWDREGVGVRFDPAQLASIGSLNEASA